MAFATVSVILAVLGLVLVLRGWVGRRVGDEPRCRKCDYELTGIASEKCPECGWRIDEQRVRWGRRKRRTRSLIIGLLIIALSGAQRFIREELTRWREICPTAALLWLMDYGDKAALNELATAANAGLLEPSEHSAFVAKCLRLADAGDKAALHELVTAAMAGYLTAPQYWALVSKCLAKRAEDIHEKTTRNSEWSDLLHSMDYRGLLTKHERELYYQQVLDDVFASLHLVARDGVRATRSLPIQITSSNTDLMASPHTTASSIPCARIDEVNFELDGQAYPCPPPLPIETIREPPYRRTNDWALYSIGTAPASAGKYQLSCRIKVYLFHAGDRTPSSERSSIISTPLNVVAADAEDAVKLFSLPTVEAPLASALRTIVVERALAGSLDGERPVLGQRFFGVDVLLPFGFAYEVLLCRAEDKRVIGHVWSEKNSGVIGCSLVGLLDSHDEQDCTVVLRPSADAARQTASLHEICGETLNLGQLTSLTENDGIPGTVP